MLTWQSWYHKSYVPVSHLLFTGITFVKGGRMELAVNGLDIEVIPIGNVIPYARNPRKNEGAVAKIAASLREFGWRQPIVVDEALTVIAGHTRLLAARSLGMDTVPVHVARGLTKSQVRAYRLADNRTGQEAEWANDLLALELADLAGEGFDLSLTGFNSDELTTLMAPASGVLDGADLDDAPPVPTRPITKPGDLITLGRHRLLCGDSSSLVHVERLIGSSVVGMSYNDPPYGIDIVSSNGHVGASNLARVGVYAPVIGDDSTRTAIASFTLVSALRIPVLIFWGANYYAEALPPSSCWIVWDKENGDNNFADCELAWTNQTGAVRIFRHMWQGMLKASERGEKRVHPTQKPVALAEWCFERFGSPGDTVLDLFGGSGSSLVAAAQCGRTALLMEKSPAYCDVIVTRWETATGQKAERP